MDESLGNRVVEESKGVVVIGSDIQEANRFLMKTELGPGDHFKDFVIGVKPAWHGNEGIGKFNKLQSPAPRLVTDILFANPSGSIFCHLQRCGRIELRCVDVFWNFRCDHYHIGDLYVA